MVKKGRRVSDGKWFAVKTVRTRDEETIINVIRESERGLTVSHAVSVFDGRSSRSSCT